MEKDVEETEIRFNLDASKIMPFFKHLFLNNHINSAHENVVQS
jgi:hypothetical protein